MSLLAAAMFCTLAIPALVLTATPERGVTGIPEGSMHFPQGVVNVVWRRTDSAAMHYHITCSVSFMCQCAECGDRPKCVQFAGSVEVPVSMGRPAGARSKVQRKGSRLEVRKHRTHP
jgi:hypothetical protein